MQLIPDNATKKSEIIELNTKGWDKIYIGYALLPDDLQREKYDNSFGKYLDILVALYQISIRNFQGD